MSIKADAGVQFAWAIANTEANLAGETRIRPVHFYLGVLKVIDPDFLRQLEGIDLPEGERKELAKIAKQVRQYLELSVQDVTRMRRSLRGDLRNGNSPQTEIHMLHRSDESRAVFQAAAQIANKSGAAKFTALHLVDALFQTGSVSLNAQKKQSGRPSTHGARWEVVEKDERPKRRSYTQWYGRNLSRLAAENNLPPFVGREKEIMQMMRVLARTKKKHIALIGPPGVGKTSLVEGLANALQHLSLSEELQNSEILEIHGSDIAADCDKESEVNKRLGNIFSILNRHGRAILFLDEIHGLFPEHLKHQAAFALITSDLTEDNTPCIIATSEKEWNRLKNIDASFARMFTVLSIKNPSTEDARLIAETWAARIAQHQQIEFARGTISATIKAAGKYLPNDKALPDNIVDLLENVGTYVKVSAMAANIKKPVVRVADIESVLEEFYGIKDLTLPNSSSAPNSPRV